MVTRNKFLNGLIAGAAAGAVAGLLFAPKPGRETRRIVVTRAGEMRQKAGGYVGSLRQRVRKGGNIQAVEEAPTEQVHTG